MEDGWVLDDSKSESVPRTFHEVIGARIELLSDAQRQVLREASAGSDAASCSRASGRSAEIGDELETVLKELQEGDLLRSRMLGTGDRDYMFTHAVPP